VSKGFRRPALYCILAATALAIFSASIARGDADKPFETLVPGTLKVCLYAGFAPFAFRDAQEQWQGWDVTYLKKFAATHGNLKLDVAEKDFNGIWLQPGLGECDIAGTGISDLQTRRDETGHAGAWSSTYYHVLRAFLVRTADFTRLTKVEDLRGRKAVATQGSTANSDLCYRLKSAGLHPCKKADGDHSCNFPGLADSDERTRETDPSCVYIEYPRDQEEKCAAADVVAGRISPQDKDPGVPFTYGGGYGSVQGLACGGSGEGDCSYGEQTLVTVWPHCNMASDGNGYAEPFSFVVRAADTGLLKALNCYIQDQKNNPYTGSPIPVLSPDCPAPPWTPRTAPDPTCSN
jgi:hypothetical protein